MIRSDENVPASVMMWALEDSRIRDPALLRADIDDIAAQGFEGVSAFVRCSRFMWTDASARAALLEAQRHCRQRGLSYWLGADPRFAAPALQDARNPLRVLVFADATSSGEAPNIAPVCDGRFQVRCVVRPRPTHTLPQGAVTFAPVGIERVYAIRSHRRFVGASDVRDITRHARFYHNARWSYVEAHGTWVPPDDGPWSILCFFTFETPLFDYTNASSMRAYMKALRTLAGSGIRPDLLAWDEPGFGCGHGVLPFPGAVRTDMNQDWADSEAPLWPLAFNARAKKYSDVRIRYYRAVQRGVENAKLLTRRVMRRYWGARCGMGIHDTWRWESADMVDMNHGSLDVWSASATSSGGFVDLGSAQLLADPRSPFYANLAMTLQLGCALGRRTAGGFSHNNLWISGRDTGREVLDQCVAAMSVFSHRWSAHIHGPAGIVGEEDSFLGLPYTPGYPRHDTWRYFHEWTALLRSHHDLAQGRLPSANVLLVYPVETMYRLGVPAAGTLATAIFRIVLALTDAHTQLDLASDSCLRTARTKRGRMIVEEHEYDAVLLPHCTEETMRLRFVRRHAGKGVYFMCMPASKRIHPAVPPEAVLARVRDALRILRPIRPVVAPENSWVTLTQLRDGVLASLCPSRCGARYSGRLCYEQGSVHIPPSSGLRHYIFHDDNTVVEPA